MARIFPATASEWAARFPSLPAPLEIWTFQESASPIVGQVAGKNLVQNQAMLYAQSGENESGRVALEFDTTAAAEWTSPADTTFGNIPVAGTRFLLIRFKYPDTVATSRSLAGKGDSAGSTARWGLTVQSTGVLALRTADGVTSAATPVTVSTYDDGAYHDVIFGVDGSTSVGRIITTTENVSAALAAGIATTLSTLGLAPSTALRFGGCLGVAILSGAQISYAALFDTALTSAHLTTFVHAAIDPAGIASTEALGSASLVTAAIDVTGIASAEALGTITLVTALDVVGIAGAEAVGAPSVLATLDVTGIASAEVLGTATLATTLDVVGIAGAEALGALSFEQIVAPGGVASVEALGGATVMTALDMAGIVSAAVFGTATVVTTLGMAGIATAEVLGTPHLFGYLAYKDYLAGASSIRS